MSVFILDASYTLTWCFPDRATANTDGALRRMEAHNDSAVVPWVWQVEVSNGLGKTVVRGKLTLSRALQAALVANLPLATNDNKLGLAAQSCGITTLVP